MAKTQIFVKKHTHPTRRRVELVGRCAIPDYNVHFVQVNIVIYNKKKTLDLSMYILCNIIDLFEIIIRAYSIYQFTLVLFISPKSSGWN